MSDVALRPTPPDPPALPEAPGPPQSGAATTLVPDIELVIPVYDEEAALDASVRRLHGYLAAEFPFRVRITIADNASTDGTWTIASRLAADLADVTAVHLDVKGRGRALHHVWERSEAKVLAYMDVDLSTDLAGLLPLVAPLLSGHSDVSTGTRLVPASRVVRGPKRELISRCYNALLHVMLAARFSDAQCGFKAIRGDCARKLLPLVEDTGWFFDTELLFLAERAGMRIHEVPVDWVDDPDSKVHVARTAVDDLKGVARLARAVASGRLPVVSGERRPSLAGSPPWVAPGLAAQLMRFGAVGLASTAAYLVLFLALRSSLGALAANAVALLVTAVANTALNRRVTFGVRGPRDRARHQLQGLVVFGAGLVLTSAALVALDHAVGSPGQAAEVVALIAANAIATALRFALFRTWVFPSNPASARPPGDPAEPGSVPTTGSTPS
jgi:putative flippase GtrA